jgi:hypothetical protein
VDETPDRTRVDRRALLRKAAAAGAVGWAAPVILSSGPVAAGVFTAKCAPGAVTAGASFTQTGCTNNDTTLRITINFSGPCPCGGTQQWCAQKNTPTPAVTSATSTLVFTVVVPIRGSTVVNGKVGLGCADRDGDRQFAIYNWTMTASDNGNACNVANSITAVTLSGRTVTNSATCPPLTAALVAAAPQVAPAVPPGYVRPT